MYGAVVVEPDDHPPTEELGVPDLRAAGQVQFVDESARGELFEALFIAARVNEELVSRGKGKAGQQAVKRAAFVR